MDTQFIHECMVSLKKRSVQSMSARERIGCLPFGSLGWSKERVALLLGRGYPEVLCCRGLSAEQAAEHLKPLLPGLTEGLLCFHADEATYAAVQELVPGAVYHKEARIISYKSGKKALDTPKVLVLSDSAEDFTVSEEAAVTCEVMGVPVSRFYNLSEAGVDQLVSVRSALRTADVVLVVSGNGASLASQIRRQTERPVLAVPTSRAKASGGLAAMMAVAETCTQGVTLCGTDNSYGAAWLAGAVYA